MRCAEMRCHDGNAGSAAGLRAAAGAHSRPTGDGDQAYIASVPCSKVNDNYCDCPDGSDEPGSAACSHLVCHLTWQLEAVQADGFPWLAALVTRIPACCRINRHHHVRHMRKWSAVHRLPSSSARTATPYPPHLWTTVSATAAMVPTRLPACRAQTTASLTSTLK